MNITFGRSIVYIGLYLVKNKKAHHLLGAVRNVTSLTPQRLSSIILADIDNSIKRKRIRVSLKNCEAILWQLLNCYIINYNDTTSHKHFIMYLSSTLSTIVDRLTALA